MKWNGTVWLLAAVVGCGGGGKGCDTTWWPDGDPGGGEEHTVRLYRFTEADHVERAQRSKRAAEDLAGWKNVFIVHENAASSVYWGRHRSREAAMPDLKRAQDWQTPGRTHPFQRAVVLPYPGQEPGDPAWNLLNTKGAYTVVVEVYFNDKERRIRNRKWLAATRCKELRERGEEAYFHHGPAKSSVAIGLFDENAVRVVREKTPEGIKQDHEIVSEAMRRVLKKHPYLWENGKKKTIAVPDLKKKHGRWYLLQTYPVRVPRREGAGGALGGFGGEGADLGP